MMKKAAIGKKNSDLTIVIPVYNEQESLPGLLPDLISYCSKKNWKFIIVDDGSTDLTREILSKYTHHPLMRVISHKVNQGYGGALKTGIMNTKTTYVLTMDGDGQHNLEDIGKVFKFLLEKNADVVVGKREGTFPGSWGREIGKAIIRTITRVLMPLPIHDLNSGFKCYRSELAQIYAPLCPNSMAFSDIITLIFINQGDLVLEYPISIKPRLLGKSTIRINTAFDTIMEIISLVMMFNPQKIFIPLSALCVIAGVVWEIPIFLQGRGVSVGSTLAIFSGLLFFSMGLLASQLSAIRMESISRYKKKDEEDKIEINDC